MNEIIHLQQITSEQYLHKLQTKLESQNLLDENRNLSLADSSDQDFLEMFFIEKILTTNKRLSPHTLKAYRSDAKTLLIYFTEHELTFRDIGFPEVKAYNRYIREKYAAKSAIRKLEFFRRLLEFGYETQFYKAHLSTWISKPSSKKGHYIMEDSQMRPQVRELNQKDAEHLIACFPKIVKANTNREQLEKRNLLIGYLLYTTGLRASELLSLNWGSFRHNRQGILYADVIGKGNKPRSIPMREETIKILLDYRQSIGESVEINPEDISPLFFALYNKKDFHAEKKRLTYASLYKIVKEAVGLAGKQTKVSPHWFRHTFVTMLLENDVPLAVVKDWAGHADISTTNVYLERVNQDQTHLHLQKVSLFQ
ncbi:tyrosine-type recombinase/integrase [Cytobacillus purgationiresistens]|uniref:Integrase/recombinase XerD n=1 Tax=Cytobacillus purgationiresistens TaxID=863449 RepID=A0ABU0ABF4_9BACI|nr:tyrosine-type recombinase/integrase [Cytobacillus purgationiresistens]MDQ0268585.1 integrase/recombinase XerD [Cytobacillus purgationiresistens]